MGREVMEPAEDILAGHTCESGWRVGPRDESGGGGGGRRGHGYLEETGRGRAEGAAVIRLLGEPIVTAWGPRGGGIGESTLRLIRVSIPFRVLSQFEKAPGGDRQIPQKVLSLFCFTSSALKFRWGIGHLTRWVCLRPVTRELVIPPGRP